MSRYPGRHGPETACTLDTLSNRPYSCPVGSFESKVSTSRRVAALAGLLLIALASCSPTQPNRLKPTSQPSSAPVPPASPQPALFSPPSALTQALDNLMAQTPSGCLLVESVDSVLYEANSEDVIEPASIMKVITAAAAFDILGPNNRYRTEVRAAANPVDGIIRGNLWLVGGGDPVLATDERVALSTRPQPHTSLDTLADRVAAAGIREIEGRVVGDESRYDSIRYVRSWPRRFITAGEIGPLSALTVNDGFSTAGHPGVAFTDPPADAGAIFKQLLEARGVRVQGGLAGGAAAAGSVRLASIESAEISEIVSAMLRDSDNGTAEMLVKEMGLREYGRGSTAAGVKAMEQALSREGTLTSGIKLADGSGLSPTNRLSCRLLTSVLADAPESVRRGLPIAGQTGTLSRRFVGTPVEGKLKAKTGSLEGVASLAGYAINTTDRTLTFAYMANGLPAALSARTLQNALAAALVNDGTP